MAQRTWFITGVNSGFGLLMTEALLERGDRVAGTVRKLDSMNDLKTKYGDCLWVAHLDMTDLSEIHNVRIPRRLRAAARLHPADAGRHQPHAIGALDVRPDDTDIPISSKTVWPVRDFH